MSNLTAFISQKNKFKETIPPGEYQTKIVDVKIDDRYVKQALILTYDVFTSEKILKHSERFIKSNRFKRTRDFDKYLTENGINSEENLLGLREKLVFKWNFASSGKREISVVDRKFLGFDSTDIPDSESGEES